jgi:anti-sigma factor RsiW
MKRRQHVGHLLIRYETGQLAPRQAAWVEHHLTVCAQCRAELRMHQELTCDLREASRLFPRPAPDRIDNWWLAIQTKQPSWPLPRGRYALASLIAPVVLSLLLAGVLATEVTSVRAAVSTTYGGPAIDTTLEPTSRALSDILNPPRQSEMTATPDAGQRTLGPTTAPGLSQTD